MRAVYFILPFIRRFYIDRQINYNFIPRLPEIKNISIFDNFNRLDPSVQQFMLSF
jgi:hypothetical protein